MKISRMLQGLKNLRKIRRTILSSNNHSQKLSHHSQQLLFLKVHKIKSSNHQPNKLQRLRSSSNLKTIRRWRRKLLTRPKKKLKSSKLKQPSKKLLQSKSLSRKILMRRKIQPICFKKSLKIRRYFKVLPNWMIRLKIQENSSNERLLIFMW